MQAMQAEFSAATSRRASLRRHLLSMLAAILLAVLLITGAIVLLFISHNEEQSWQGRQREAAHYAAESVATFLQHQEALIGLAGMLDEGQLRANSELLQQLLRRTPALVELTRIDGAGEVVASASLDEPVLGRVFTLRQSGWFNNAQAGKRYLGDVQLSSENEPYLIIAVPAANGGVVAARLRMNMLWDEVRRMNFGQTGRAYVVNRGGMVIAHRSPEIVLQATNIQDSTVLQQAKQTPGLTWWGKYVNFEGRRVVGVTEPLPGTDWLVITEIESNEVIAVSRAALLLLSGGVLIFGLLAMAVTIVVLSGRVFRPMEELRAGAAAIARGNLAARIVAHKDDEIGEVAHAFNHMARAVQERENALQRLTRSLEQRGEELTRAMATAEEARSAAEQASQLKSQFLANMSHELRTPLNSIINFTRLIVSGVRGPVNEGQVDYLNRVRHSGEHLLGLINDILDLSKIEAGRMELYKEPTAIGELLDSIMSTASGLIKGKQIELRQEVDPNLPLIEADRTRVRQILLNLLSNAAKFTDQGSITVSAHQQEAMVVLRVSDTGIGIAPEHLQSIFEEFRQIEGESNRRYEGTGLGLAICRRFVELHGGRIWIESSPGQGSSFSFSLPIQAPSAAEEPLLTRHGEQGQPVVLVIDDDQAAIEIISAYLARDGFLVYGLSDSRRAVEQARLLHPAAILLDVIMPHKDGWEVLAELKADPQLQPIPVAFSTIVEDRRLGFQLGASAYLTKPIDEQQLRTTVAALIADDASILVVDDDPNAREIITAQLNSAGSYSVQTASGGREALERIRQSPPQLIVLDLMMPEVDGLAVLETLEHDQRTRNIPVIILTAKDLSNDERRFLSQRVASLLQKGCYAPEELRTIIRGLLAAAPNSSPASPAG